MIKITETSLFGRKGNDFILNASIENNGIPIDLTGCSLVFSIKDNINNSDFLIERQSLDITDAENGEFHLEISKNTTENFIGKFYYDIEMTDSVGIVTTIMIGTIFFDYVIS